MENLIEINNKIKELFDKNEPFSLIRVGNTEGYFLQEYFHNRTPVHEWYIWMFIIAGIFPDTDDYLRNHYAPKIMKCMENSDVTLFVDVSQEIQKDQEFKNTYINSQIYGYGEDISVLDPGFLVGGNIHRVNCDSPWTEKLSGKKVLVISPFVNTIKQQWEKREKIWGENLYKMNNFELVDVIRPPFHPVVEGDNSSNYNNWGEVADSYTEKLKQYDYDVLLIGAGAYAPVWADAAKRDGKIGITICGVMQLFFGIVGPRWAYSEHYKNWRKMFNENWIFPLKEDLPKNYSIMTNIENSYW